MNQIKTVIWDMGGVILRTEDQEPRTALAKEYGISIGEIHDLVFNGESGKMATLGKIDEDAHWFNLGQLLGLDAEKLKNFRNRFWLGDRLDQTLVSFIRNLKLNYTTALLSNAWTGARHVLTHSKPCIDAFDVSVFSCEIGLMKPDPAIYKYVLSLCMTEPQEAIFIDDALENIKAAQKLGIHAVWFFNTDQAVHDVNFLLNGKDEVA
jgi:epoxide hydrolase-like predicted phosphatase